MIRKAVLGRNYRNLDGNSYEVECRTCGHDSFSLILVLKNSKSNYMSAGQKCRTENYATCKEKAVCPKYCPK